MNLMTAAADPKNHNADVIEIMREEGVAAAVVVGDIYTEEEIPTLKDYGFKVIARQLNPTIRDAKQLEAWGVDIIIISAAMKADACRPGHTGTMMQVALFRNAVDIPVLAAGGIINEKFARASAILGAEGAFAGTRFILSKECRAAETTKQNLLNTPQDDFVTFFQWRHLAVASTPNPTVLAAVEANRQGNLDPRPRAATTKAN